jgi:uncharacterized protein YciI
MSLYAVAREAGPAWVTGKGAFEQDAVNDHAGFMGVLADNGTVVFAGPLGGSEQGRIRVLLIAEAESEHDVRQRLARDPWEIAGLIVTTTVEPWTLLVGAERLVAA